MADKFTPEQRSRVMARVKGYNTGPEMLVRRMLHRLGYRFRLHRKDLPGSPDIVLPRHKKVIFVHGCFWHGHKGCHRAARPSTNTEFWNRKIDGNISRDRKSKRLLQAMGWRVLIVWQCKTKDAEYLLQYLASFLLT